MSNQAPHLWCVAVKRRSDGPFRGRLTGRSNHHRRAVSYRAAPLEADLKASEGVRPPLHSEDHNYPALNVSHTVLAHGTEQKLLKHSEATVSERRYQ